MAYTCYYHKASSSAADWLSKLFTYIEAMGWVKEKGLEVADGAAWQNTHGYAQGDVVKPTTPNGFIYICSTAGTSAGSEPSWGTTLKGETTSSTAKFRAYNVGRVYSSQSESDAEPKTYVYLYYTADVAYCRSIGLIGVAQWAAATWLCSASISESVTLANGISANPCYSWVYGNKDAVVVCTAYSSSYYYSLFGVITPVWTLRTTLTSSGASGPHTNLVVTSSTGFTVGQWLQMWGATEEGRDKVIVEAVPDATHITVVNLPRNYSSGSWIGVLPVRSLFVPVGNVAPPLSTSFMGIEAAGTEQSPTSVTYHYVYAAQLGTDTGPDYRLQKYLLRPVYYQLSDYVAGFQAGIGGYLPVAVILQQYKVCASLDLFLVYDGYVYPVSGTATSGGATTLTDTGKALTIDAWIGYILVITAGVGIGQTRRIISNTATEFTVNTWDTNPDSSSVYAVVTEAWRAIGTGVVNCPVIKEIL
jgi:hypothetical protein